MEIEKIYIKYFHDVFLYIRALSGNESIAEEITQETFVSAMKNLNQFDGRKDIRAWLFTIGKHAYFRYCKRNRIYAEEQYRETMEDSSPPALDQIIREETIQRIETKVEALPSIYREVFRLRIYGELSFEKIGKSYGKSLGWARVTYYRAKQMIQREINKEEGNE